MKIGSEIEISTSETIELANYAIDLAKKIGTELGTTIGDIAAMAAQQQPTASAHAAEEVPEETFDAAEDSIKAVKSFFASLNNDQLHIAHELIVAEFKSRDK